MDHRLTTKSKMAQWRHEAWLFFKAQLSAQLASLADFLVTIGIATLLDVFYLYATFIGSVVGGVVNCAVNYRWVFQAKACKKTHVAVKYLFVWGGSLLLNTWGTFALTEWLTDTRFVNRLLGQYVDSVFIVAKLAVAILVAFLWNYQLQRVFVYRNHSYGNVLKRLSRIKK